MKWIILLLVVLLMATVLSSCSFEQKIPLEKQCAIDKDCVPAGCCHAKDALNTDFAPDCEGAICTLNCEPNTLDCGQGEIRCVEGECQALITAG
ncbi:MAG TPA: hypothetical protein VJI15_01805 [Candidatus Nanoarchaeia archaeon]|nr:hypothetical protein [Candidatus Nanoarchaeia archaeon]